MTTSTASCGVLKASIDVTRIKQRQAMVNKKITRWVKDERSEPHFETIDSSAEALKLAGRAGRFDLASEYGIPKERAEALDSTTELVLKIQRMRCQHPSLPVEGQ